MEEAQQYPWGGGGGGGLKKIGGIIFFSNKNTKINFYKYKNV
jgi:hypothetical protein